MYILHQIFLSHQGIDVLEVWVLDFWRIKCPVVSHRNEQKRPRGSQSGDLHVIGLIIRTFMDRHAAFTYTAPEEMGRHHNNRRCHCYPIVQSGQYKSLCSTSGFSRRSYLGWIRTHLDQKINATDTVPNLQFQRFWVLMVPSDFPHLTIAYHIICPHYSSHPC